MRFVAMGEEVDLLRLVLDQQGQNTVVRANGAVILRFLSQTAECEVLQGAMQSRGIALRVVAPSETPAEPPPVPEP